MIVYYRLIGCLFLFVCFLLGSKKCCWICGVNILLFRPFHQISFHCISIFSISIIFWFNFTNLKFEGLSIQVQGCSVTLPDMKGDIFSIKCLHHCPGRLIHQLLGETQSPVRPLDGEAGDVAMGIVLCDLLTARLVMWPWGSSSA